MVGVEVGWSVVEEWLLSEGACCGGSEAGERRSERGDTTYSPRVPRGGAFGHRRTNLKYGIMYYKPRNRACREKVCNLSPCGKRLHRSLPTPPTAPSNAGEKIKGLDATIEDCSLVRAKGCSGAQRHIVCRGKAQGRRRGVRAVRLIVAESEVPETGLEPVRLITRPRILSPLRLPFHHSGFFGNHLTFRASRRRTRSGTCASTVRSS